MSVPEGLRGTQKLEVIEKALNLADYTETITANKKIFTQDHQKVIDMLTETALAIFMDSWEANNVLVKTASDYAERRALQENAIRKCNNLLPLMQFAQKVFHLKLKRIKHWGGMTIEVRKQLRAWKESDYKRYSSLLK